MRQAEIQINIIRALSVALLAQFAATPAVGADWGYEGDFAETNKYGFDRPAKPKSEQPPPRPFEEQLEEPDDSARVPNDSAREQNEHARDSDDDGARERMKELDDISDFPTPQLGKPTPPRKPHPDSRKPKEPEHLDATTGSLAGPDDGDSANIDDQPANYDSDAPSNIGQPVSISPRPKVGVDPSDPQWTLISSWLNILGLVTQIEENGRLPSGPDYSVQLTESQRAEFSLILKKLLNGPEQQAFRSVGNYWPALSKLLEDPDHRANYRLLFRSLLSMRADSKDITGEERIMLAEALGPKRIAEPGPPPLTEDAINAYTDMACFIYEHNHAGKTVDAEDNRELYQLIVRDKFANAPSERDKAAMNDFPLSWAKFRILYTDANESEKLLLATRIASEQGTKGLNIRNAMLEEVLSCPVWKKFVISSNVAAKELNASHKSAGSRTAYGASANRGSKTGAATGGASANRGSKTGAAARGVSTNRSSKPSAAATGGTSAREGGKH